MLVFARCDKGSGIHNCPYPSCRSDSYNSSSSGFNLYCYHSSGRGRGCRCAHFVHRHKVPLGYIRARDGPYYWLQRQLPFLLTLNSRTFRQLGRPKAGLPSLYNRPAVANQEICWLQAVGKDKDGGDVAMVSNTLVAVNFSIRGAGQSDKITT